MPGIGAGIASVHLHNSSELLRRQTLLQRNIELFDRLVPTEQAGSGFPLKVINIGDEERAVAASAAMLESGYYTSAVFFPIVKRGAAGLRIMLRADNTDEDILGFATALSQTLKRDVASAGTITHVG